ncbi:MAG TPA: type II secretion system F family protein [Candidatus Saccharimonadales bacterium]|jgi:type II secretory pathway component PulF|nr:type II secretion system F family protein [Candidatus Saccharimonadales bacterium]
MGQTRIRLRSKEKLMLFSDLSTMLTAGIPILETIESLEHDTKGNLKEVLAELKRALNNGEPLSHAMARFPRAFDAVIINLMRAAESGGTLEETLQDIVKTTKKEIAFSSGLKTALIYPLFVMVLFTGIILLMLTFVIPRISKVFTNLHVHVPWATRQLIHASAFFIAHWMVVVPGIIGFVILLSMVISANRRTVIRMIFSLPGLKRLGLNIDLARLTRSLGQLLKAGVPIEETLTLSKRTVQKKQVIAVIEQMQRSIEAGKPLGTGLRKTNGVIPAMMSRSIETAEVSGTLEQTLHNLAEHFDTQVEDSVKAVSSILEPAMIVVVGVMVGGLMITVIAPIYNLTSQIQVKR